MGVAAGALINLFALSNVCSIRLHRSGFFGLSAPNSSLLSLAIVHLDKSLQVSMAFHYCDLGRPGNNHDCGASAGVCPAPMVSSVK